MNLSHIPGIMNPIPLANDKLDFMLPPIEKLEPWRKAKPLPLEARWKEIIEAMPSVSALYRGSPMSPNRMFLFFPKKPVLAPLGENFLGALGGVS